MSSLDGDLFFTASGFLAEQTLPFSDPRCACRQGFDGSANTPRTDLHRLAQHWSNALRNEPGAPVAWPWPVASDALMCKGERHGSC